MGGCGRSGGCGPVAGGCGPVIGGPLVGCGPVPNCGGCVRPYFYGYGNIFSVVGHGGAQYPYACCNPCVTPCRWKQWY